MVKHTTNYTSCLNTICGLLPNNIYKIFSEQPTDIQNVNIKDLRNAYNAFIFASVYGIFAFVYDTSCDKIRYTVHSKINCPI